mgnify:CR=1 FL=1
MTSVNVTTQKNTVTVQQGDATTVTVTTQGAQGATGAGISAGDKGALTVAANLTDWTLNDSVVTNAKGSASAAIQGTKISPNFGSQNITTNGNAVFGGNLTVSGTTTTINTQTLDVEDINVTLGKVGSPTDITANLGGISLLGDTTKTFQWLNATDSWTSSEHIALPDNKKLQLGNSQDLAIFHDGSNSRIQDSGTGFLLLDTNTLMIRKVDGSETMAKFVANDAVELYYDNAKRLSTRSFGCTVHGTLQANTNLKVNSYTGQLLIGTGNEFSIQHDDTDTFIENTVGNLHIRPKSSEEGIKLIPDGAVELYHDNVKKFQTTSYGVLATGTIATTSGNVRCQSDSHKITAGADNDLEIFHDGSNSVIKDAGTGMLKILGSTVAIKTGNDNETLATFVPNGAVSLFHDNSKKFETTSSGITVQGSVTTEDMNMSNLNGTANEVDNTKGSWSIQEGADDLFIINRVSGKKYKFNLTEIF